MDDVPQGGSGGVPDRHAEDREGPQEQDQRVRTIRAGKPVAEQGGREESDQEQAPEARSEQ